MLNEYEQKKYDTISKLVSKKITVKEAIELLDLKETQIYRLKKYILNKESKVLYMVIVEKIIQIKRMKI